MDLREQLQTSLGSGILIERELGGGGMSHVFVARDVALGRRIVVKVLLPELAAGMSADRFRREILLAANLQHPHIVPLLAAGDAEGLPWYTMPFIEGESLRARIARGGELPVHEAVRVLRQVALALAHAHERGVVHRDIKPENVLLSGGAAMVTDFGVAKALSEAGGDGAGAATSSGLALGTPAYMAPEQAAADPSVDHRADLYALGVVAYELLSGQTPFGGRTPQALLAAHVVEPPPPLDRRRPGLSPALVALVMRCLAKRAADRPQSAGEVLQSLDALATPSGGSAATVLTPAAAPAPQRIRPRPAVLGATALVLLGAGWWTLRGRRPDVESVGAPPAMAAAADPAADSNAIAVLPLVNVSRDTASEYFSDGMTDELIGALGQVPGLRVASRTSAFAYKGKGIDVREIGRRLNVRAVLEGTVRRADGRVRLTAQLTDARSGLALWSDSYERQVKDVFAVQDDIARSIVGTLRLRFEGGLEAAGRPTGPRSVEAHDLYLRGKRAVDRLTEPDLRLAIKLFHQAIALDSSYAMPWIGLSSAWSNLADDWLPPREAYPKALEASRRAVALAPDLADAHAELSAQLVQYQWDLPEAEREVRRALALNPNLGSAWVWLHIVDIAKGDTNSAVAAVRKAVALDPLSMSTRNHLARTLLDAGRLQESLDVIREASAADPTYQPMQLVEANVLTEMGNASQALAILERIGPYGDRRQTSYARALAKLGRKDDARRELANLVAASRKRYVRAESVAGVYVALGEADSAFAWLERGFAQRSAGIPFLLCDHRFAPLRTDPRMAALLRRVRAAAGSAAS